MKRQTTVLFGGSNGSATLCAVLGDPSDPRNEGHTLRVVTRHPERFLSSTNATPTPLERNGFGQPRTWQCDEQRAVTDLIPTSLLPTRWMTRVGAPSSVFGYSDQPGQDPCDACGYDAVDRAIGGRGAPDDGGVADVIVLACPVFAHLTILRRIARSLYKLDARRELLGGDAAPPLFIGSLYAAGGFDWMCRLAFEMERPPGGAADWRWHRRLALFGLRSFPYLCKSTKPGHVTLYGRYPQLGVAVAPSTPMVRGQARKLLHRVLQCRDHQLDSKGDPIGGTAKTLCFLGLGHPTSYTPANGEIESAGMLEEEWTTTRIPIQKNHACSPTPFHAKLKTNGGSNTITGPPVDGTQQDSKHAPNQTSATQISTPPPPPPPSYTHLSFSTSMTDAADPYNALGFLSCTMNATNQILHPCIMAALFDGTDPDSGMGYIKDWPDPNHKPNHNNNNKNKNNNNNNTQKPKIPKKNQAKPPRFYADGASRPEAGRLIVAISVAEFYPLMTLLDAALAPWGHLPISSQHGGEPVGRFVLTEVGNHPLDVARRAGVLSHDHDHNGDEEDGKEYDDKKEAPLYTPWKPKHPPQVLNHQRILERIMSHGLSRNTRLGSVPAPTVTDPTTGRLQPNVQTRFFLDDVPHGLCVALGLAELCANKSREEEGRRMELERHMGETLALVRKLQGWMQKEYVSPSSSSSSSSLFRGSSSVVQGARDLHMTSAPQAFGITTMEELAAFLQTSPFGETLGNQGEVRRRVRESPLVMAHWRREGGGGGTRSRL